MGVDISSAMLRRGAWRINVKPNEIRASDGTGRQLSLAHSGFEGFPVAVALGDVPTGSPGPAAIRF
jgi:hypothetical protein